MGQLPQILQLAVLFDCLDEVLVWVKDRDGRYRWVNRAFLLSYAMNRDPGEAGPESEKLLGKTDYDLSPTFLADQFRQDDEYVLTGKRIVNRIEMVGQPDGLTVWNVTNKIPLVDADGAIIGTGGHQPAAERAPAGHRSGDRIRPGSGLHARPLSLANSQPAVGSSGSHVGQGVRAQVPQQLPPHAPEVLAQASDADGRPGAGLRKPVAGGSGARAAASPIRATSRASSDVTSAALLGPIASTMPREPAMPLLAQILPLVNNK